MKWQSHETGLNLLYLNLFSNIKISQTDLLDFIHNRFHDGLQVCPNGRHEGGKNLTDIRDDWQSEGNSDNGEQNAKSSTWIHRQTFWDDCTKRLDRFSNTKKNIFICKMVELFWNRGKKIDIDTGSRHRSDVAVSWKKLMRSLC